MLNIVEIGKKLGITEEELELYGKYKAKINGVKTGTKSPGKLILVTSVSPTPAGEGKTTMSIALNDGMRKLGYNSIACLREPSLGPVFGIKGGAIGGGLAKVVPSADINLHFTSDLHAIGSANNLLCAIIDNHIFQGNALNINPETINIKRCLDINERSLRDITINGKVSYNTSFVITVATEIMAVLCLADSVSDLRKRLDDMLVGFTYNSEAVYVKDLKCTDSLLILLKEAIKPNLVQTLEENPVLIHGGPFANIAHGCSSVIATKMGLNLCDYVITEAGFGSDLGAEKFLDLKCQIASLVPSVIVLNVTIKSIIYNSNDTTGSNIEKLNKGIINFLTHLNNLKLYTKNIIVCLNKFNDDTNEEVDFVRNICKDNHVEFSEVTSFRDGSDGCLDFALKVASLCQNESDYSPLYKFDEDFYDKIDRITKKIYHLEKVTYSPKALEKINKVIANGWDKLGICIAKTPVSFSDNPKNLGLVLGQTGYVNDVMFSLGASFIVLVMGDVMLLPGLGKSSAYLNMKMDDNGKIEGMR